MKLILVFLSVSLLRAESIFEMELEELMEIRVSVSSLFEEGERETPSVVASLSRDDWLLRGSKRGLRDLLDFQPGVLTYSSWGGTGVGIRGFTNSTSTVRGKAYLLDGVPLNNLSFRTGLYGRSNINPQVFDTMEMIRGPGSAIYGADAFTGVISLNTYDPSEDESELYSSVSGSKLSEFSLRTSQDLSDNQRLTAVFSASGQGNQNLQYQSYQIPNQTLERDETWQAGTGLLKWKVESGDNSYYEWTFLAHQWETDEAPGFLNIFGPFFGATSDTLYADTRFHLYKGSSFHKFDDGRSLEIHAYHWNSRFDFQFDARPPTDQRISGRKDLRTGLQFRLKSPDHLGNSVRWILGVDLDRLQIKDTYLGFRNSGVSPDGFDGIKNTTKGLFYQARASLNEKTDLHYGLRIDRYPGFGNQLTPRLGVVHRSTRETTWKALYGNAFRAPTAGEIQGTGRVAGNAQIKPEEMDTFELVYMHQSRGASLQLIYFQNRWKDGIEQDPITIAFDNIDSNESSGFEMVYKKNFFKDIQTEFSASRIRSSNNVTDVEYEAFPRYILNLQNRYEPEGERWALWSGIRYMGRWKDGPEAGANPLGSYLRTDLSLSYELNQTTRAYFWIRNLLDRDLKTPSLWSSEIGIPESGRTIGVGFTVRF